MQTERIKMMAENDKGGGKRYCNQHYNGNKRIVFFFCFVTICF